MHARNQRTRNRPEVEQLETRELPASLTGNGLLATYYDNSNFTGLSAARVDATVNFNWGSGAPLSGFGANTFSVRWTGLLEVPTTGTYTFYTRSDDGVRLWVNGQQIINNWTLHGDTENRASITLTAGQFVAIRMDYFENQGSALAKLLWSGPGISKQIIAQKYLYSTAPTITPPAAPANLTASLNGTTVNLAWQDNSSNESGFQVERSTDGVNFTLQTLTASNATAFQQTQLSPGTYYYRVKAVNSAGVSSPTNVAQVTVLLQAPAAPGGLSASVNGTTVSLSWADNSSNETGFELQRSTDGLNFSALATLGTGATSYQDSGLAVGTYSYRVRAVNAAGASNWSAVANATVAPPSQGTVVYVNNSSELESAMQQAAPGTTILLRAGVYQGNIFIGDVHGTAVAPILIGAADPSNRPIIRGGGTALMLSDVSYIEVRDLIIESAMQNGVNIDDGSSVETPTHHVTLRNLLVRNIGLTGNQDGIKLSGVQDFLVDGCTVENWGQAGQGIDMVGCHRGVIEDSTIRYNDTVGAYGLQAKGGSTSITIRNNLFDHAGGRAIQLGGNTGLEFFRPQPPAGYEAKDITVEHNVIVGGKAAIAFVNVDGSVVRFNTIYCPTTWVIRILQENTAPGFVPCRNGVFTDNIVVWRSSQVSTHVNVGPDTAAGTFTFARNWWYNLDNPSASQPSLPSAEIGGTYGIDPLFVDPVNGDFHLRPGSPAQNVGAYAG